MDVFAMDMVDVSYTNEWNDISNFKYATLIDQAQLWHGFKQNISKAKILCNISEVQLSATSSRKWNRGIH